MLDLRRAEGAEGVDPEAVEQGIEDEEEDDELEEETKAGASAIHLLYALRNHAPAVRP